MIWTKEEEEVLKRLWPHIDTNRFTIAEILTNRSPGAIAKHASEMNLKKKIKISIDYEKLDSMKIFEI